MDDLKQFYNSIGADSSQVVCRLGGSAELVKRFLIRFKDDKSFENLSVAICNNNNEEAFRAAHTLKGVCANLGLEHLFEQASAMTELLRSGETEKARLALPALEQEHKRVFAALENLK